MRISKTPEYKTWSGMIKRCKYSCVNGFKNYGGRGIRVCKRWTYFWNFLKDMGNKPSPVHSIDRINNNGHYRPSNCRWATPIEQARTRRANHMITFRGRTQHLEEWSRELGIKNTTIRMRLKRGWTVDAAFGNIGPIEQGLRERGRLEAK